MASMNNYPLDTEQWKINLIENPPPSSKLFSSEEWKSIVLTELFKHPPMSEKMKIETSERMKRLWKDSKFRTEVCKKISLAQMGRIDSNETNEKRRIAMTGFRHTEKSKKLMKQKAGHSHIEETKRKLSIICKGTKRSDEFKEKLSNVVSGRVHITNGIINKFVHPKDIPIGFWRGRILK